jgi:hypothetical protein
LSVREVDASRFLARQLIVTGSILALVYLLLLWVEGLLQATILAF